MSKFQNVSARLIIVGGIKDAAGRPGLKPGEVSEDLDAETSASICMTGAFKKGLLKQLGSGDQPEPVAPMKFDPRILKEKEEVLIPFIDVEKDSAFLQHWAREETRKNVVKAIKNRLAKLANP